MSTMTNTELSHALSLLAQLLQEAENPASQDAGPTILQKQEFDSSKVTAFRVIKPHDTYRKPDTDGTDGKNYEPGYEIIDRLLTEGYQIVTVAITRESNFDATTQHQVIVIMVKLRD